MIHVGSGWADSAVRLSVEDRRALKLHAVAQAAASRTLVTELIHAELAKVAPAARG